MSLVLICSKFWTQFIQEQTNMTSNVVPVLLRFLVSLGATMVGLGVNILISSKIWTQLIKKNIAAQKRHCEDEIFCLLKPQLWLLCKYLNFAIK